MASSLTGFIMKQFNKGHNPICTTGEAGCESCVQARWLLAASACQGSVEAKRMPDVRRR
jgi:hypothetical protein